MKWPKCLNSGFLMIPEGGEGGGGTGTGTGAGTGTGTGTGDAGNTKITIGGKEYTPEQAQAAIQLHNAMSDPDTSREIVQTLASRMGILDKKGDVKDDKKTDDNKAKLEGKIHKTLLNKLGKEYAAFADLVGPALDEAIAEMFSEARGQTDASLSQQQWESGVNEFMRQNTFTTEIEAKMGELVQDSPPNTQSKTFSQERYLSRMYRQACSELEIEVPKPPRGNRRDDDDGNTGDVKYPKVVVRERPKFGANEDPLDRIVEDAMKGIRYR